MHKTIAMIGTVLLVSTSAMAAENPGSTQDLSAGWRLHPEASRFINPQHAPKDIVWSILFEGNHVRWNLVRIPQSGPPTFESFENDLGAAPMAITGSSAMGRASVMLGDGAFTVKTLRSLGDIKETSSNCALTDDKKQLRCHGAAAKSDGTSTDFEVTFDRM